MPDPRITKLAKVLVHYSLELKPGQHVTLRTNPLAEELALEVYREAIQAGAHVFLQLGLPGAEEVFYKHASENQLDFVSPVRKLITETFDAYLGIGAEINTRQLSGVDPKRMARVRKASAPLDKVFLERAARNELRWCYTEFPTHASAQEADMGLAEYRDFVFGAGMLDEPDPVAAWQKEGQRQKELIAWLKDRDKVIMKGPDVDLRLSIKGRTFKEADGKYNFPDGEIFTGPVEDSANGWIRFRYPAIYGGREVTDIELWFEDGKVVREKAGKGEELLTSLLDTDEAQDTWENGASAPITTSRASPRICCSTRNSAAPSTWPSAPVIRKRGARITPAYTGICSATCRRLRSGSMANCFTRMENRPYKIHYESRRDH